MDWWLLLAGFAFGVAVATVTTPVGVSGAVFLLPVQLSVLGVPSPAVTPTNLLYNVVAVPGALARFRRRAPLRSPLARDLLTGTVPGVVLGAVVRVYALPDGTVFRVLVALFLLLLGVWLVLGDRRASTTQPALGRRVLVGAGFVAGTIGGIYGIGGGSLLAPVLVGAGYALAAVAPAALCATFVTSCAGAAAYAVIAWSGQPGAAPDWWLGLACGLGGLVGGSLGAALQPRLPQRGLRVLLGVLAITLAGSYLVAVVSR